jgi:hypothetical protein
MAAMTCSGTPTWRARLAMPPPYAQPNTPRLAVYRSDLVQPGPNACSATMACRSPPSARILIRVGSWLSAAMTRISTPEKSAETSTWPGSAVMQARTPPWRGSCCRLGRTQDIRPVSVPRV